MPALATELRNELDKAVQNARAAAEAAARAALTTIGVTLATPPSNDPEQRLLRNALRARARQHSGTNIEEGMDALVEEIAYEQWHRMLFARFLAENGLLMHPQHSIAVTLEECKELAGEEGATDAWDLAARYASVMLPGIFRRDDPAAQVRFAAEGRLRLESIIAGLPGAVFLADDSIGWVYQFWQTRKKKEVNESGRKIGGADIAPVTQLFTEDYMVRFLLENSLGAWWAARHPNSPLLADFEYLRYLDDGAPAAGSFRGWPNRAAAVTVMDPCCGSGHFLVAAFDILRRMRMEEEGLSEAVAADAVLRDNLFGLEIDSRCTQIAAFALAFAAWKAGGYRKLPLPNIACSGIALSGKLEDWTTLAGDDVNLQRTLDRLYHLFRNAPDLGSLINPADVPLNERMFASDYTQVAPLLEKALARGRTQGDPVAAVFGEAVGEVASAAKLLAGVYVLVATNVPYLGRDKETTVLREFSAQHYPDAKADLATCFLERCRKFTANNGVYAIVTPQNWLFLASYKKLRVRLLKEQTWHVVARLGPGAFDTISGEVVNVALLTLANQIPPSEHSISGIDASKPRQSREKAASLAKDNVVVLSQQTQLNNPDSRVVFADLTGATPLSTFAYVLEGMHSGDYPRFGRKYWEVNAISNGWSLQQGGPDLTKPYAGREHILFWENGNGTLMRFVKERLQSETVSMWIKGDEAWGKKGLAVSTMVDLKSTIYTGEVFTHGVVVIIPRKAEYLHALWLFCQSDRFRQEVRNLDQKVSVARATFDQVPFDLTHWQAVAEAAGPLPEPHSSDPTQWIFKGQPDDSTAPLQVAVVRLLGYCWPQQEQDVLDNFADEDGIVCLPATAGEAPATERLRAVLAAAFDTTWSPALQDSLLQEVGFGGKGLETWLRDGFFAQHCALFHNRPFIWQIWDGRKDGFSALLNYHKLDDNSLAKLIYTYLGSWIDRQSKDRDSGVPGADDRLVAALQLQRNLLDIRAGEPPYDIYVRWKKLSEQPIGWQPDLNDGVRLNIRPFVTAGILRNKFTINWNKDRGNNPDGSERLNDLHYSIADKRAARQQAGS